MSRQPDEPMAIRRKMGPPQQPIQVRLQPHDLAALDAFVDSAAEPVSRPQAIRAILSDWLATHGFLKRGDHPKPTGPATDAIEAMEAAIKEHKAGRRSER